MPKMWLYLDYYQKGGTTMKKYAIFLNDDHAFALTTTGEKAIISAKDKDDAREKLQSMNYAVNTLNMKDYDLHKTYSLIPVMIYITKENVEDYLHLQEKIADAVKNDLVNWYRDNIDAECDDAIYDYDFALIEDGLVFAEGFHGYHGGTSTIAVPVELLYSESARREYKTKVEEERAEKQRMKERQRENAKRQRYEKYLKLKEEFGE